MTEYLILKTTNESDSIFAIVGEAKAASQADAVRNFAEEPGTYAAIPLRSWQPLVVELAEVTPRFKLKPLTDVEVPES